MDMFYRNVILVLELLCLKIYCKPQHLLVIMAVALLIFGPRKLPELGKGLGEGIRGFKNALKPASSETDT
jgi:TatA/E family protein of Tat protein translocase